MGIEGKRRGVTLAKIGENQTEILPSRTVPDANLACERFLLRGLLRALTRAVKQPTVIDAADAIAFYPAGGELRASVRAAKSHDVGRSRLAAVECETFAHDLDWFSVAGPKLFCSMYGMPEPAHKSSGKTPRLGGDEIFVAKFFTATATLTFTC